MNRFLLLLFILSITSSFTHAQDHPEVKCLSTLFQKERIELANTPRLDKRIQTQTMSNAVGDTLDFWVLKHNPLFDRVKAVCKAVGKNSYIFVETGMWDLGFVDETDVEQLLIRFEEQTLADSSKGIFDMMIDNFGPVPDALDNDPRVYIVIQDLGDYGDGYFMFFDQYTQEQIDEEFDVSYKSNEKEILYLNARNDVSSNLMLSVAAHELEHMIHWNMDPDEETWIDEGCAEYAMFLYGYPDPIILFNLFPDDDLTIWEASPFSFIDYVEAYLFTLYVYEKYGGANTIKTLVAERRNGIDGVTQTLTTLGYQEKFEDVFSDWVLANYLDDATIYDGKYGYTNAELPPFEASRSFSTYPIPQVDGTVSPWAADYIWMNNGSPQTFNFNGNDNGIFHVNVMKIDTVNNVTIDQMTLNEEQDGTYDLSDFDDKFNYIVFAISNQKSFGVKNYSYSSTLVTDVENELTLPFSFTLSQNYPNPFNPATTIKYSIPSSVMLNSFQHQINEIPNQVRGDNVNVLLKVYDILGNEVATLINEHKPAGNYEVKFDAGKLTSGIYFYKLQSGNFVESKKMLLIK